MVTLNLKNFITLIFKLIFKIMHTRVCERSLERLLGVYGVLHRILLGIYGVLHRLHEGGFINFFIFDFKNIFN
jgi:hypothetical protein